MNAALKLLGLLALAAAGAGCNASAGPSNLPASSGSVANAGSETNARLWGANVFAVCPDTRPHEAQCLALIRTGRADPDGGSGPNGGFTPAQLEAAYNLPSATAGSGQLVAIVDAYDNPYIASDLAAYRSYFGLPAANFAKYNQEGQTGNYPEGNQTWGFEEDNDVDMASASCPNCTIALIEANSNSTSDLEAAEDEAVTLGAHIISNSYGCYTPCGYKQSHYDTPGVTYLAATGDWGYGVHMDGPAQFDSVVATGATALYVDRTSKRGFREKAWFAATSGCTRDRKPTWQHDPGCSHRTETDAASLGDPTTGPAIYDTYGFGGWTIGGGTSAASPFLAGVFALAGNATSQHGGETFWRRSHEGSNELNHITAGENGSCDPAYLCKDGTHEYRSYGGPTGWGTPNGIGAF